jgi:phage tail sheath protein FI
MSVRVTYPGVYLEEVQGLVRTIVGVSTSVTAFLGAARRGPVNRPVHLFSFGDFERRFGGLDPTSELSYAVYQFFLNEGSDAWVVRLAKNPSAASLVLQNADQRDVLEIEALDKGAEGNRIEIAIDHDTRFGASTFNLQVRYRSAENPADSREETFVDLSMNRHDPRYVGDLVNGASTLVRVKRPTDLTLPADDEKGTSTGRRLVDDNNDLLDVNTLIGPEKNQIQISVNGLPAVPVILPETGFPGSLSAKLKALCKAIKDAVVDAANGEEALAGFECKRTTGADGERIQMTSGKGGEASSVRVLRGERNDATRSLGIGTANGGLETDAVAGIRPAEMPYTPLENGHEEPYGPADEVSLFNGSRSERKGIYALEHVDIFNLLCLPGVTDPTILDPAMGYCRERRAFLIVDPPAGADESAPLAPAEMQAHAAGLQDSSHAAVFYPRVRIGDPLKQGKPRVAAPSGTLAGVFARTDSTRGVWKAPAGTDASLAGVRELTYSLTDSENGVLNPLGINCLRSFPVYGPVVWGARTLRGDDRHADPYKYVPVRRLALYIEESLYRGTQWVVFEPNDEPLWAQIRLNVGAFLHDLFRQGAFQGATPREAYQVKCDGESTTQNDIDKGIVNIIVAFAPLKPAEFVIIKIQQIAGQIQT